jgi:5-methylcytosine-specific restriction endonuclease McrA
MEYKDQIKDARWQEKRLKVMQRDGFECCACPSKYDLNVHHLYYEAGCKIWEYDNESLVTLCADCHKAIHKELMKLSGIIAFKIITNRLDAATFANLN